MSNEEDLSSCLKTTIKEAIEELREFITEGSYIQDKNIEKISLDYTFTLGQIEGLRLAIDLIKEEEIVRDNRES